MEPIYIGLAGAVGAVGSGLLGWLSSKEPFTARKFIPNLIRAVISGATLALTFPFIEEMGFYPGLIGAFLTGAGVDVVAHRIAGTIK